MINNEDNGLFNNSFLDMISVIGFAISIYNLMLNEQQLSNDDVAREVQINRSKLDEQNSFELHILLDTFFIGCRRYCRFAYVRS